MKRERDEPVEGTAHSGAAPSAESQQPSKRAKLLQGSPAARPAIESDAGEALRSDVPQNVQLESNKSDPFLESEEPPFFKKEEENQPPTSLCVDNSGDLADLVVTSCTPEAPHPVPIDGFHDGSAWWRPGMSQRFALLLLCPCL